MTITNSDVVVLMGKDAVLKCKAAALCKAVAQEEQTVLQRKGKPRVAARLAGSVTSRAREPSHRRSPRRAEQVR